MRHGQVWAVVLEPLEQRRAIRSWDEAWRGPPTPRNRLVLVTAPWRAWPENDRWAGWWRSRLVVGDLDERAQEAILADFRQLLLQTPPVMRNWRQNLARGYVDKLQWYLTWVYPLTVLV
jgi:hypothetical protein